MNGKGWQGDKGVSGEISDASHQLVRYNNNSNNYNTNNHNHNNENDSMTHL